MENALTQPWADQVVALCEPVFTAADVEFEHTTSIGPDGTVTSLLWEANPNQFAAAYPDSGVVDSHGDQWADTHCLDYWVTFEEPGFARISVEGWDLPDLYLKLRGNPLGDGYDLRNMFARILAVTPTDD